MYFFSKSHSVGISAVFRDSQSSPLLKKLAKPCNFSLPANLGKQHCMSLHLAHIFKSCPQVLETETFYGSFQGRKRFFNAVCSDLTL